MTIEHRHRAFIQARSNPFLVFFCLLYVCIVYLLEVFTSGENLVVHKTLVNPSSSSMLPSKLLLTIKQIVSGNLLYSQNDQTLISKFEASIVLLYHPVKRHIDFIQTSKSSEIFLFTHSANSRSA